MFTSLPKRLIQTKSFGFELGFPESSFKESHILLLWDANLHLGDKDLFLLWFFDCIANLWYEVPSTSNNIVKPAGKSKGPLDSIYQFIYPFLCFLVDAGTSGNMALITASCLSHGRCLPGRCLLIFLTTTRRKVLREPDIRARAAQAGNQRAWCSREESEHGCGTVAQSGFDLSWYFLSKCHSMHFGIACLHLSTSKATSHQDQKSLRA